MQLTRRQAMAAMAAPALGLTPKAFGQTALPEIEKGPFDGSVEGLKAYRIPTWFQDAKFGIWAHWGPQSAAEDGDWYARNIYIEGQPQYKSHLERFGHPSKVGGIGISLVNYIDELPYFCDEVVGRLERMGLREKPRLSAAM